MAEILLPNSDRPVMTVPHAFEEGAIKPATTPVILHPHPFETRHIELHLSAGWTVAKIIREAGFPAVYDDYVRVWIDDWEVPREFWGQVRPKPGRHVYVRVTPQGGKGGGGGKSILGTILMLVVVVVAAFAAPYLTGLILGPGVATTSATFAITKGLIGLGITMLGGLLVQSLVKPPKAQVQPDAPQPVSQRALLTGIQNRFEPYAYIPRVFGRRRLYPLQGARPYTEAVGQNRFVRALLCVGWGPIAISDIKIGDTPIEVFQNIEIEVREGWTDETFGLFALDPLVLAYDFSTGLNSWTANVTLAAVTGAARITHSAGDGNFISPVLSLDGASATRVRVKMRRIVAGTWQGTLYYSTGGHSYSESFRKTISDPFVTAGSDTWVIAEWDMAALTAGGTDWTTNTITRLRFDFFDSVSSVIEIAWIEIGMEKAVDLPQTLFTNAVNEEQFSVVLPTGTGIIRTTAVDAEEISVDVSFPGGLAEYDQSGGRNNANVRIDVDYRLVGSGTWLPVTWDGNDEPDGTATNGRLTCADNSGSNVVFGGRWKVAKGQYEVRLTRFNTNTPSSGRVFSDRAEWSALRTIRYQAPVTVQGIAYISLRMRATDQFNGLPDQINCIAQSYLPVYDGSHWIYRKSRNPAWAYADIMRRRGTERIIPDSRIDLPTLSSWATACDALAPNAAEARWSVDSIYEGGALFTGMREIAGHGRASFVVRDGKYSVVRDIQQTVPVQHITPRNSSGYSGNKPFVDYPHALRVNFINEARGYQDDSIVVYYDGYTSANATKFETLDLPGCTSATLAWREARYHMAVGRLRPEEHTVTMDIEALRCTGGDLVQFSHDVINVGLGFGRVKALVTSGANTTGLVLDAPVPMAPGINYGIRIRKDDGTSLLYTLVQVAVANPEVVTVTLSTPVATSTGPGEGDLFMFGEASRESAPMIVKRIEPGQDFTLRVVMMDAQPGVYTADTGTIPAFDSFVTQTTPVGQQRPALPSYALSSDESVLGRLADGSLDVRILVGIAPPGSSAVATDLWEVQFREAGSPIYRRAALVGVRERNVYIAGLTDAGLYDVRVRAISDLGPASEWAETLGYTAIGKTTPPPDVTGFTINIVGDQAHLTWSAVDVLDLSYYRVRHSKLTVSANYADAIDLAPVVPKSATSVVVPALTGTYFVKAVDVVGLASINPASSVALIEGVKGLNAVASSIQHPTFPGTATDVTVSGGTLILGSSLLFDSAAGLFDAGPGTFDGGFSTTTTSGTYDWGPVDLGAIYTSRVTTSIRVVRVDYASLFDTILGLFDDRPGFFDGEAQAFDDVNVELYISTTPDNPAGSPVWSAYRRFVVGDYTARGYRFRAILTSLDTNASPQVSELAVYIDMPDRVARGNNVASGTGGSGLAITFSPAFYAAPAIAIAAQNLATGDYFTVTGKTNAGFTITFRNSAGTVIDRTFDWQAAGYGELAL